MGNAGSNRVQRIFFNGLLYMPESFASGATVPVEPLGDFFSYLVDLNKQVEPDRSPPVMPRRPASVRRLTAENPIEAILARLQQFTSATLAGRLVERRAATEEIALPFDTIKAKATGIAWSMRSALDYLAATPREALVKRVLGLYYGTIALAQAEMLASPSGPIDLDQVEGMTKRGHGLYALAGPDGGFADLRVGVLATGFLPQWMSFLGHDTSSHPRSKPNSAADLDNIPVGMACSLRDLFASMPEIDDLFAEVFGGPPGWVSVAYDDEGNARGATALNATPRKATSTYGLFLDRSGEISIGSLESSGWPLAEIRPVDGYDRTGTAFCARVDHAGHDVWWTALPIHSSPFRSDPTLLTAPRRSTAVCEQASLADRPSHRPAMRPASTGASVQRRCAPQPRPPSSGPPAPPAACPACPRCRAGSASASRRAGSATGIVTSGYSEPWLSCTVAA